jgi:hypothetical protein
MPLLSLRATLRRESRYPNPAIVISLIVLFYYSGGGADGSMLLFPTVEPNFEANNGISDSVNNLIPFMQKHNTISAGDIVQFAGAVALSNCPVRNIRFPLFSFVPHTICYSGCPST